MKKWILGVSVASLAFVAAPIQAQMYFGQNQVQYENFDWQVIETDHFYVHYYTEMKEAALDAARMAERSYSRLSTVLSHQFREKKPLILFSSRGHFGQNHVTGDLGEGTGGVTEAIRHRVLLPFTGDYLSFERVLTHELVHSFQYDIFARGRAGGGLAMLQQLNPPLWLIEGMAEYLALGPNHPLTDAWMRDAAVNGKIPSIEQLKDPSAFFPYRYGESVMRYIGAKWGDAAIGRILNAITVDGVERAIERELNVSSVELGEEWADALQTEHLPDLPNRQRPRAFATPLLSSRRSGGQLDVFLAPSLSSDGRHIAFFATGSFARGEVFMDLWLADAESGKRLHRLVESTFDPDYEELRLLYSQSAFSPDGKYIAFTAQREGQDVLYLLDVAKRKRVRRFELPNLDVVMGPSFSPDGQKIVFSGSFGGTSDLYIVNVDNTGFQRLTNDKQGDLQPQWSPDGNKIVFATERAPNANFETLVLGKWQIATFDLNTKQIEVLPQQGGLNLNPMWAPDGRSVAFISDRTGTANIFLYDFDNKEHYQLTDVVGSVSAITEYSPALTWARTADILAFTYFDDGNYNVWKSQNPRKLKSAPFRQENVRHIVAAVRPVNGNGNGNGAGNAAPPAIETSTIDSLTKSFYRSAQVLRASGDLPDAARNRPTVSMAALRDSSFMLPDTTLFKRKAYKGILEAEFLSRPSIGYSPDNFGQGVYGQSVLILADMLGNQQMALAGGLNGRLSEAQFFGAYSNLSRRFQYMTGIAQEPVFYYGGGGIFDLGNGFGVEVNEFNRYVYRSAFAMAQYPFDRFKRVEFGLTYNHVDRATMVLARDISFIQNRASDWYVEDIRSEAGVSFIQPSLSFVTDNTLFGYTGPIMGTRARAQIEPAIGGLRWISYLLDARRYEPVVFNYITIAARAFGRVMVGRDEEVLPGYIGHPSILRGYNRESYQEGCTFNDIGNPACSASRLLGSRIAVASAELRFPLVRQFQLGVLPLALPPIDGLVFYDVGMAWSTGDRTNFFSSVPEAQQASTRYPLRSYGYGVRLNLYNIALLRWDYAIPLDLDRRKGFWTFSIGPSW